MSELKLQELERRIKLLEKQNMQTKFNYYTVSKSSEIEALEHNFNFEILVKSDCYLSLETLVNGAIGGFFVKMDLNGASIFNCYCEGDTFLKEKLLPFPSGNNIVHITVTSESALSINNCMLKTFGNIEYPKQAQKLSVINESERSIILHIDGQRLSIKSYHDQMQEVLSFDEVKDGAICKLDENLLVVVVGKDGNAIAHLYDSSFQLKQSVQLDEDINSVSAISASPAQIFAVRGNRIYRYDLFSDLSIAVTQTEHRAKKISGNPSVSGYIIIIDHAENGKLIKI